MSSSMSTGPLEKSGKFFLMLSAAATILTCYLFSLASIVLLLLLLALEFALLLILLRFGLAGVFVDFIKRHSMLVGIFVRNLWLSKGVEYQIPLPRDEAPELFAMLDSLSTRLKIAPPSEVRIEMNFGAWVRMRGYGRGRGYTVLGIGYDLLVALNMSEFEAVMAHEMAHAKLVQRGLRNWLVGGLSRITRLSHALSACVASYREHHQSFPLASFFWTGSDGMTRLAARLFSAYSRQDEFEADRGAAELCGATPLRTSLLRLEAVEERLARLPWAERISRTEAEVSFSGWLAEELVVAESEVPSLVADEARDPYSTHPALPDRLAALPDIESGEQNIAPAIGLLREPDKVAAVLIEEINRIVAVQEEKDMKLLAKAARKAQGRASLRWPHLPALIMFFFAFMAFVLSYSESNWRLAVFSVVLIAGGAGLFRLARYRDRRVLPVPRFAELKKAWQAPADPELKEHEAAFMSELKAMESGVTGKSRKVNLLVEEAFAALGRCEYLRAHVATRLALQRDNKSVEAALGNAVASASLGMHAQVGNLLVFIRSRTGLLSSQIVWGAAWAFTLCGDWSNAEAFLWRKHREIPDEPTFLLLLAFVQQQRGKLQSAIANVEKGLALSPQDVEAQKLLGRCLLDAGRLQAAARQLHALEDGAKADPELAVLLIRLKLLQRDLASAQEWAGCVHKDGEGGTWLIRLGEIFEHARHDEHAFGYFHRALTLGFYPEAHVGLARIAARRKESALSRQHLLSALDMGKTVPEGAAGPGQVFRAVVDQLMQLDRAREQCRAWIARFPTPQSNHTPDVLRGRQIMVYAPDRKAAEGYLDEILDAIQPTPEPAPAFTLNWSEAPKDQQPVRPVYPGVQHVL